MDDASNYERLKYEQEKVLQENQNAQKSREKLKDDYLKLQTKLQTLPDMISEDAMVPIGSVAFFPGHLIHTNEIMVLLGDNWFVERSAKQSIEIIERRIRMVEKQLSDLQGEETRIKEQKNYTNEFLDIKKEKDGIKEIQEEVTEESLPRGKGTVRKAHKPKHNQLPRSVKFCDATDDIDDDDDVPKDTSKNNNIADTIDHNELFARLNELEKEEQEEEERLHAEQMKKICNGEYKNDTTTNDSVVEASYNDDMESNRRHVKFKTSKSYDSDDEPMCSRNLITFTHTQHSHRERSASESDLRNTINSPADVFEQFVARAIQDDGEKPLKSILKKDSRSNSNENLKLRPILKTSPEHQPGTPELSFDDPRPILKTPPDSQGSDRRPGTPEYMLCDDPKPSILKSNNGIISPGVLSMDIPDESYDPKPILKFGDSQLETSVEYQSDTSGEETRSILKTFGENTLPERPLSLDEVSTGSKPDNRKPILKSPDNVRSTKLLNDKTERRPSILKNTTNEVISDRVVERVERPPATENPTTTTTTTTTEAVRETVVERTGHTPANGPTEKSKSGHKPVSKFKASRSRK